MGMGVLSSERDFQDLGELRGTMKEMLELLKLVERKIKAPNLL
jgi:hypothetical protein